MALAVYGVEDRTPEHHICRFNADLVGGPDTRPVRTQTIRAEEMIRSLTAPETQDRP